MSPRFRLLAAGSIAVVAAVLMASDIADESFGFAGLIAACTLWVFLEWRKGASPEAWILAAVSFGYIVGNRGFAQFQFTSRIPLLPAETALLFCTLGLGIRAAMSRARAFSFDLLDVAILMWLVFATLRLPMDIRDYGVFALRDYALAYYAVFYFLTRYACSEPHSAVLLERSYTAAFIVLPLAVLVDGLFPGIYGQYLSWNGIPLIYYKSDLISASLVCGSFWFWSRFELSRRRVWLLPSAISLLMVGTEESPRAALVAAAVTTAAWLYARRPRLVGFQLAVIAAGVAISVPLEMARGHPLIETKSYEMYERLVSIVDINNTHSYLNSNSAYTTDNNQFRRVWWNAVYEETMATNPLFGLGFGHDLAARFLADYNWISAEEEFNTRSPHSIILTNFGRLGFIGLGLFLLGAAMIARSARVAFKAADLESMAWWSIVITVAISACFGVVLEGPMGAVIFWVALGVARVKTAAFAARSGAAPHEDK